MATKSKPAPSDGAAEAARLGRREPAGLTATPPAGRLDRIAGLPAVEALFQRRPERVLRLFYEDGLVPKVGGFCAQLARWHRPYRRVDAEALARIAGTVLHGGIVAVAEARPVPPFDPAEAASWAAAGQSLFVLDGVGNPHNLGAIARTLAFLGYRYLVISDHPAQAGLSDAAYRVAEGGLEYLTLRRAAPLAPALKKIADQYRVVGTALRRGVPLAALGADPRPVAVVLGNEEQGLPRATLDACEAVVTLPGSGTVQSLNVAATAAILAYAFRPRSPGLTPRQPGKSPGGRRKSGT
ncbi:TrmH family RNA methyltransferase [Candidatus Methylocalor cossyra]|uniref:TrmH family RNA methyltransferase n=1 Tax=Candidatus Methylocalor cossyra TaxID=3108543 RepID=UPI0032B27DAB